MVNVVWFKRDLRVVDHRALLEASLCGEVLGVYVYEPEVIEQFDYSEAHHRFINDCLTELRDAITDLGSVLLLRKGRVGDVLKEVFERVGKFKLWSHEEAGNSITFKRDLEVREWIDDNGCIWQEFPQNGVVRKLKNRDGWAAKWQKRMRRSVLAAPLRLEGVKAVEDADFGDLLDVEVLGVRKNEFPMTEAQQGGRRAGMQLLGSFLHERGNHYRTEMSSPLTAFEACSRLSPYISWGALSIREVYQAAVFRRKSIEQEASTKENVAWRQSLKSFISRLSWHCHFMQKLEDQPDIDEVNIARSFDHLRRDSWNQEYFEAWKAGKTGYPMIDACMRALAATGYLNFRMRAMVMSFASYHLWLCWREPGLYLARCFVDYEPGIHWSQVQMQSGTTGINSIRVYSPTKQAVDQDPKGEFIRKWINKEHIPVVRN